MHYTDQEIINATGLETGDNIFFFDKFATISRAYTKLPYLEEVVVERRLPGTLTIRVVESKALAYLAVGDEEWTIDRSCKVLGKAVEGETEQLIPIYGVQPGTLLIGERLARADGVEERVDYLSAVLGELQDRRDRVGRFHRHEPCLLPLQRQVHDRDRKGRKAGP